MDHYVVSARKYRPSTFDTVVGQRPLTAALKHSIATDRLAHAYLFCGSRGVGKTSCARIFAKTINCEHRTAQGEACNECASCQAFNDNNSFNIIELDAASHNGVDDMRALIEQVQVPPTDGRYRVFIIDEVHMLTAAAFNAFLKTLEEPPEYVVFILATTEKHKIIPTILSRCQIYDFNRITIQDMVDHLSMVAANEGVTADRAALNVIARQADGAMRDALSIFDQVAASTLGNVTYQSTIDNLNILDSAYYSRLVEAFLKDNVPSALLIYQEVRQKGFDSQFFINGLGQYLRDLMVAQQPSTIGLLEASDEVKAVMAADAVKCPPTFLYKAMSLCNDADLNYRTATNKQFLIELTLVKLCQLLSPSPNSGDGEGQLKPIAASTLPAQGAPGTQTPPSPQSSQSSPRSQSTQSIQGSSSTPSTYTPQRRVGKQTPVSMSIRINSTDKPAEAVSTQQAAQTRKESFSEDALKKAWTAYIDSNPTERILVNTMLGAMPVMDSENRFSVSVDDQIQVETLNEKKSELLKFLRDALHNDFVDFTVRLNSGESSPATWTTKQVFTHMLEEHPALKELVNTLSLTL